MSNLLDVAKQLGLTKLMKMRRVRREVWDDLIASHFTTRSVQTLLNVGFLEHLRNGPESPKAYAEKHGLNPRLLKAICESLYARRILTQQGEMFGLDDLGRLIVESNLARGWFDLAFGYEQALFRMEDLLRNRIAYGTNIVRDGKYVGVGSGLASMDFYFPLVRSEVLRRGYKKVLDIGCGDGTFLRYLCESTPGVEGVGVDLSPAAVEAGNEALRRANLLSRIRLHEGDAMDIGNLREQLGAVDGATTFFVLHELCDNKTNPRALDFLRSFRGALPGVPLHIVETVRPTAKEMREQPGPAIEYFFFHDLSNQTPIGREAWLNLLRTAGFQSVQEDFIAFARSSIYTVV
jgi:SAM-dependent methyltransferase